jgi:hypothetical protein
MRRAFGALLIILAVVACSEAPANAPASGGTTVTGPGELPPISQVWFGTAFDPASLALTDRASTFKAGTPVVAIGTLFTPRPAEEVSVTIETGGSIRQTLPVAPGGSGSTFGVDLSGAGLGPGSYLISFKDKAQKTLASASVTITQ